MTLVKLNSYEGFIVSLMLLIPENYEYLNELQGVFSLYGKTNTNT